MEAISSLETFLTIYWTVIFQHPVALFMSQVYALFTVLKCNLVFVFRCFFHYHFHATCFGNSLPSSGLVPLTSLQFIVRIDVKLKYIR
jgi:hypothetical protein